jgi:hypothetical protein
MKRPVRIRLRNTAIAMAAAPIGTTNQGIGPITLLLPKAFTLAATP